MSKLKFATKHQEREDKLLLALRNGRQSSKELAIRIGLKNGRSVSSLLRLMVERGYVDNSEVTRGERFTVVIFYKLTKLGEKYADKLWVETR